MKPHAIVLIALLAFSAIGHARDYLGAVGIGVSDPKGVVDRIRELGGKIEREATPHPAVDGSLVGLGRDPDNYVVEVLQRQ